MGLDALNREVMIKLYWEKSVKALRVADEVVSIPDWATAANRLYYCAFYALSALFLKDGNPINSHRGAKSVLYLKYVSTGKLDNSVSSLFSKLQTLRDKADYDIIFEATEKDINDFRPQMDGFLAAIKALIDG